MTPEVADTLIGVEFKVKKFGAVMYDNADAATTSSTGVETSKADGYNYKMP